MRLLSIQRLKSRSISKAVNILKLQDLSAITLTTISAIMRKWLHLKLILLIAMLILLSRRLRNSLAVRIMLKVLLLFRKLLKFSEKIMKSLILQTKNTAHISLFTSTIWIITTLKVHFM